MAAALRLTLVADTHIPRRAGTLPGPVWRAVRRADLVVHAGDWVSVEFLDEFTAASRDLLAVHGNNDGPAIRDRLPEVAVRDVAGCTVAVVHDTGPAVGRATRCAARFPGADVLVFGHSHVPWQSVAPGGLRLLNPGSPTDRRREPTATYLTAGVRAGRLTDVRLHRLSNR